MSDFKFSCPGCGQRILANDDYVGYQINCPGCQAAIIVPSNPAAPAAPAARSSIATTTPPGTKPPPAPPSVVRLSVSALESGQPQPGAPLPVPLQQHLAAVKAHVAGQNKKSYSGLMTAVVAVALIGLSAYLNKGWLTAKWKAYHAPSAAEIAATNQPPPDPPPPAELTASEVMQKVAGVYKALPSYSSTGKATAILDMSAFSAAMKAVGPQTVTTNMTLKMSRQLGFRIEMAPLTGSNNATAIGWSTNNLGFYQASNRRHPVASHDALFSMFNTGVKAGVSVGVGEIVRLFTDDASDGLAKPGLEWTRNPDERIGGQPCYVLAATIKLQNVLVWINRKSFLIAQTKVVLDATAAADMDDAKLKELLKAQNNGKDPTLAQIADARKLLKTSGSVTETYGNIQTNLSLALSDIEPPAPVAPVPATPAPAPAGGGGPGGGGGGPGGGGRGGR